MTNGEAYVNSFFQLFLNVWEGIFGLNRIRSNGLGLILDFLELFLDVNSLL
jgi:hypothetical protein